MTQQIEQEQKMNNWAETYMNGRFKKFIGTDQLKLFYVEHNMPTQVSDCVVDGKARLTLMIAKQMSRKSIQLCKECGKKVCDEEKCGAEDYVERQPRAYIGADQTGQIKLGVPPFKDNTIPELENDVEYVIEGTIREFNKVLELNVESVEKVGESATETEKPSGTLNTKSEPKEVAKESSNEEKEIADACSDIETALELFDGEVPEKKFTTSTNHLDIAILRKAMTKMHVKLVDGVYKVVN